ncbi:unnamed protein product [Soboliphyme baturini]|uniref:MSP domain-containing protein n=1 Tax=Soboliphyme baturini TaxID=241478 RepID=A0A183INC0_9BILA|nr:unnamed protein product [Soboliphyme baturini]
MDTCDLPTQNHESDCHSLPCSPLSVFDKPAGDKPVPPAPFSSVRISSFIAFAIVCPRGSRAEGLRDTPSSFCALSAAKIAKLAIDGISVSQLDDIMSNENLYSPPPAISIPRVYVKKPTSETFSSALTTFQTAQSANPIQINAKVYLSPPTNGQGSPLALMDTSTEPVAPSQSRPVVPSSAPPSEQKSGLDLSLESSTSSRLDQALKFGEKLLLIVALLAIAILMIILYVQSSK